MSTEVILMFVGSITTTFGFSWYVFQYQKKELIDPLNRMMEVQQDFRREVEQVKEALDGIQKELKHRLIIKDGTPIEVVIEKMSFQFDLMIDRDEFNFYLDSQAKIEFDCNGLCTRVNEKFTEITGLSESQCIGYKWTSAIREIQREPILHAFHNHIQEGLPFDRTFTLSTKNSFNAKDAKMMAFSKRNGEDVRLCLATLEVL